MSALPHPTPQIRPLVQAVGLETALALIEAHGGTRIYLATRPCHNSELVRAFGAETVQRLADALGAGQYKVPVAREWRIQVYRARKMTYAQIARAVGCDEKTVHRTLQISGLTKQLELPGL